MKTSIYSLKNFYRTVPPSYYGDAQIMVYDSVFSIYKNINYYQAWDRNQNIFNDFSLIRYEDLQRNLTAELQKTGLLLGVAASQDKTWERQGGVIKNTLARMLSNILIFASSKHYQPNMVIPSLS